MQGSRIGVDVGGTKIEAVVLDGLGAVVHRERIPTLREEGYDAIVRRIAALVGRCREQAPDCVRVGIGAPGAVSARTGRMKNCNTTCLNGQPLREDLEALLGMEVLLENDANLFALAEARQGAAVGAEVVFGVILGTGVGGGLVWRGELRRGPQHLAGEWGHHSIDPLGPACYCGHRGCVETFLSGPALERDWRERTGRPLPAAEVAVAARAGDPAAVEVMASYLDRFGRAVANLVDILDPDAIVLGGGLSNLPELYAAGREAVQRYVFNDELRTPILPNRLGDSAGVIGAALLGPTEGDGGASRRRAEKA